MTLELAKIPKIVAVFLPHLIWELGTMKVVFW